MQRLVECDLGITIDMALVAGEPAPKGEHLIYPSPTTELWKTGPAPYLSNTLELTLLVWVSVC